MIEQVLLGSLLLVATTLVHGGCTAVLLQLMADAGLQRLVLSSGLRQGLAMALVIVFLFYASLIEAALWAAAYVYLGALPSWEAAMYFSTVTLTTVGYGDISLTEEWRLLSSFEAANGVILFGWSTALVFAFLQRMVQVGRASREPEDT